MFSLAENDLGGLGGFRHDLPVIFSMSSGIPITSGFSISSSISIAGREKGSQPLRIRRITAYPCPEITGPGVLIFPPEKVLRYRKAALDQIAVSISALYRKGRAPLKCLRR